MQAVFDASALLRALLAQSEPARDWTRRLETGEVVGLAPDLIWAETAHALRRAIRASITTERVAAAALANLLALPIRSTPVRSVAAAAFARSGSAGVTVYDACYLVLADAADAVLVTADSRLAEAASRPVLIA